MIGNALAGVRVLDLSRILAVRAARTAHEGAADARVSYRSAPTDASESAMLKAAIKAHVAHDDSISAQDAVKTALAARDFVMTALRAQEQENPNTV